MLSTTRRSCAVVSGPGRAHETVWLSLPEAADTTGLLKVQASGICGTDVELVRDGLAEPTVLGHHVVGTVVEAGATFLARRDLDLGDQVVVEEYLPCGDCAACKMRHGYRFCPDTDLFRGGRRIGLTPVEEGPGLWGGNAEHLYLPANAIVHRVSPPLKPTLAVWTLPLANAMDWISGVRPPTPDDVVLVVGPGQHGLAAVVAARLAGARTILMCGLAADRERLETARRLGANTIATIDEDDDPTELVAQVSKGRGADLVVVTAGPLEPILDLTARRGTVVLAGGTRSALDSARLVRDALTVRGVRGRDPDWINKALSHLADGTTGFEQVPTEVVGLDVVGSTLVAMASGHGPDVPHVVVQP